jgi:hypothetical protein
MGGGRVPGGTRSNLNQGEVYNIMWKDLRCDRSMVYSGSSTNKTDRHDITEILLKVALNTIKPTMFNGKWLKHIWKRTLCHRRLAVASEKVYQLRIHGRWFSPGTPASSTTKTGRHNLAEILLKVALNTKNQIKQISILNH